MKKKFFGILFSVLTLIVTTFLVACGALSLDKPENVSYDGTTITWNAVDNADKYTVQINEGAELTVTSNSYPYESNSEFSVTITAVSSAKKIVKSGETTVSFKPLDSVTEIRFSETGEATWDPVNNADGYEVMINGVKLNDVCLTPSFSGFEAGVRSSIQVRPIVRNNKSYYSKWSSIETITKLGVVEKESISYSDGIITWTGVANASTYEVSVNGQVVNENCATNSLVYEWDQSLGNFDVTVKAKGNGVNTFNGETSSKKTFVCLETVKNIDIVDGILQWGAVPSATGYKLELNGRVIEIKDGATQYDGLIANSSTTIRIMGTNEDNTYFASWSAPIDALLLPAPVLQWNESLELDGEANNNIFWDGVANASGYTVRFTTPDGKQTEKGPYGETERAFADAYMEVGTYTVEVKSNANKATGNGSVFDSIYSAPIQITRLAAPTPASNDYIDSGDGKYIANGFTVNFNPAAGADGYVLYQDNNEVQNGSTNQFKVAGIVGSSVVDEQTFNYMIRSTGSVRTVNGITTVKLGCLTSESLNFKITVLAVPTTPNISGYEYTYGEVAKAYGYTIDIDGEDYPSTGGKYNLSGLEAGQYTVRVAAKGNGADVLPSNLSQPIEVYRLEAPYNLKVLTSDSEEGQFKCELNSHAKSCELVFDNNGVAIPTDQISNMNQYIKETGTTVYATAVANYFNEDKTIYYMTSQPSNTKTFTLLAKPTFGDVAFTNTQLIWKAPANMNTAVYTPTYEVYKPNQTTYNGEKNGTTMSIAHLAGGESYTFQIKAIGNGTDFLNSGLSEPVTIYKIATPKVERVDGAYQWKAVSSATTYAVYVDGVHKLTEKHEANKTYSYVPDFSEIKTYKVEVFAIGDNGYTTIDSDPCLIEQQTKQLEVPDFTFSYSEAAYDQNGKIILTISRETPYADGYYFSFNNVEKYSEGTTCEMQGFTVGDIKLAAWAKGGNFDENGVYYLTSQIRGNNPNYTITLLGSPNTSNWKLTEDGDLTWGAVSGASSYQVEVIVNGTSVFSGKVSGTRKDISEFLTTDGDTVIVKISANGNGTTIVSSATVQRQWDDV